MREEEKKKEQVPEKKREVRVSREITAREMEEVTGGVTMLPTHFKIRD